MRTGQRFGGRSFLDETVESFIFLFAQRSYNKAVVQAQKFIDKFGGPFSSFPRTRESRLFLNILDFGSRVHRPARPE